MAFVLGLGFLLTIVTMSSFKGETKLVNVKYRALYSGMSNTIVGWENIDGEEEDSNYECQSNPDRICTAEFPDTVTPTASTPVPSGASEGNYSPL